MPTSVRELVLAGLKTELDGITGIAGLTVFRNEDAPIVSLPALNQVDADGSQRVIDRATGVTVYGVDVAIEGYVAADVPAETGPALSELYANAVQAAKAAEASVAAIFEVLEADLDATLIVEEGVKPHAFFRLTIEIRFATAAGNPFIAA